MIFVIFLKFLHLQPPKPFIESIYHHKKNQPPIKIIKLNRF